MRAILTALILLPAIARGREWTIKGTPGPVEAEYGGSANGFVLLRGPDGKGVEVPLDDFSTLDRAYLEILAIPDDKKGPLIKPGKPVARAKDYQVREQESLPRQAVTIPAATELHLTGPGDPLSGSFVHFTESDGWLFFDQLKPSDVGERFLDRFLVNGEPADTAKNLRIVRYGSGTVVIPQGPEFAALTLFGNENLSGDLFACKTYEAYGSESLDIEGTAASSFVLKRGYMATLAANEDGTGFSRNYVAQDHDVVVEKLPKELDNQVNFVRVFPWRWTTKKGVAGGIQKPLEVSWYYDWNIGGRSTPECEYVAIKQKNGWPSLNQDWRAKGINHLLGFNEPDRPDQANMSTDDAIRLWPELQRTGLRLGSPATSDGGLGWLYDFIEKADREGLRVDFVAVHYYRAVANPRDDKGAAEQMYNFLKAIHDRTGRPIWITEWNNGANWTNAPDPDEKEQRDAIEAMTKMLDEAPFVERYAPYNWVEDCRKLVRDDGSLTPAGEIYRDTPSPVFFQQPKGR